MTTNKTRERPFGSISALDYNDRSDNLVEIADCLVTNEETTEERLKRVNNDLKQQLNAAQNEVHVARSLELEATTATTEAVSHMLKWEKQARSMRWDNFHYLIIGAAWALSGAFIASFWIL